MADQGLLYLYMKILKLNINVPGQALSLLETLRL